MTANLLNPQNIINTMIDSIRDYSDDATFDNWFNDTFNADPYIIGQAKANENLMNYQSIQYDGPLAAFRDAHIYFEREMGVTDEITEEETEPEKVATRLAYCIADFFTSQAFADTELDLDDNLTDENQNKFLNALKKYQSVDWYDEINNL